MAVGIYYDGRSGSGQPIGIILTPSFLKLTGPDGNDLTQWPTAEVRLVAKPGDGQPPRLRNGFKSAERLTLADGYDLAELEKHCPNLKRTTPGWSGHGKRAMGWGASAIAAIAFMVFVAIPQIALELAHRLPAEKQREMGNDIAEQVIKVIAAAEGKDAADGALFCTSPSEIRLLRRIASQLAATLDEKPEITVQVVDLDIKNAFALPGGQIVIFRGLLEDMQHGNELAGVLAHEIAHVYYRHPTELFLREIGYGVLIGMAFGDLSGGWLISGAGRMASGAAYGRQAETDADQLAVQMMNGVGWDAEPMAGFFQRIHAQQGDAEKALALLMSHPRSEKRAKAVAVGSTGNRDAFLPRAWTRMQKICSQPTAANETSYSPQPAFSIDRITDKGICMGAKSGDAYYTAEADKRGLDLTSCERTGVKPDDAVPSHVKTASDKDICIGAQMGNPNFEREAEKRGIEEATCGRKLVMPTVTKHLDPSNIFICGQATYTYSSGTVWTNWNRAAKYVKEAKRRGLTLDDCRKADLWETGELGHPRSLGDAEICWGANFGIPGHREETIDRNISVADCERLLKKSG